MQRDAFAMTSELFTRPDLQWYRTGFHYCVDLLRQVYRLRQHPTYHGNDLSSPMVSGEQ